MGSMQLCSEVKNRSSTLIEGNQARLLPQIDRSESWSKCCFLSTAQCSNERMGTIASTQVMVYHWWIPCETLVHTGSR